MSNSRHPSLPPEARSVFRFPRLERFFEDFGAASRLAARAIRLLFTTRFEWGAFVTQLDQIGVKSVGIGLATAIFVGIVMAIQFAVPMERFGARDSVGRVIGLSEFRELAPSLTSLVVGCRVAAGIAAELGSMAVTEQIDAIRVLGADPIRKLVIPRICAATLVMPLMTWFALFFGIGSAAIVCDIGFGVPFRFFISSAIDAAGMNDLMSGIGKTPFFGFLIGLLGCYYGMGTRGGTEGVGKATTTSVVVVAMSILVADAVLTQLFFSL